MVSLVMEFQRWLVKILGQKLTCSKENIVFCEYNKCQFVKSLAWLYKMKWFKISFKNLLKVWHYLMNHYFIEYVESSPTILLFRKPPSLKFYNRTDINLCIYQDFWETLCVAINKDQDDIPPMSIFFMLYPHYNQSVLKIRYHINFVHNLFKGADCLDLGLHLCQRDDFINSDIFQRTLLADT